MNYQVKTNCYKHREIEKGELNVNSLTVNSGEKGAALVTTLLIMMLLLGFVALALSRTSADNLASGNDAAEAHAFGASEAGLEDSTRDFATVLEQKLSPTQNDIDKITNSQVNGFSNLFDFTKSLTKIKPLPGQPLVPQMITSGDFNGLYSLRDEWEIDVTAREKTSDAVVTLSRRFYNDRIPLFQFGAFYNDDLELNRPPLFTFGGRVHTNGNLFVTASPTSTGAGIYFSSKVTAAGQIVDDIWKTNTALANGTDNQNSVFFPNNSNVMTELATGSGSVNCSTGSGPTVLVDPQKDDPTHTLFTYPKCAKNPSWATYSQRFSGNLTSESPKLILPVDKLGINLVEMVRRGKNVGDKANIGGTLTSVTAATQDDAVLSKERFANKPGLRISLADSHDKLPGCAAETNPAKCGVRLDQNLGGSAVGFDPNNYPMKDPVSTPYKTTPLNANRLVVSGREMWIKVEMVTFDGDNGVPVTQDVTQDFLSLGVTQELCRRNSSGNCSTSDFSIPAFAASTAETQDARSIIKLQRFYIDNNSSVANAIPTTTNSITNEKVGSYWYSFPARSKSDVTVLSTSLIGQALTDLLNNARAACISAIGATTLNALPALPAGQYYSCVSTVANNFANPVYNGSPSSYSDETSQYQTARINSKYYRVVPFPIEMYDAREGNRCDGNGGGGCSAAGSNKLYANGMMSMVDIDVYNLKRFFQGDFDNLMPTNTEYAIAHGNKGLKSTDVPESRGWIIYVSDRRGDNNFDGRYDMEQVDGNGGTTAGQDLNNDGVIQTSTNSTSSEGPYPIDSAIDMGLAAVTDHQYYRRGVRLINGVNLPGHYDPSAPQNTQGVTFASENGIYVKGNYNVQNVTLPGGTTVAASDRYYPQNSVPSAVVADSVTVLSKAWNDANSFLYPFDQTKRVAQDTQVRFAMIAGDGLTFRPSTAQGAGSFYGLNGGIHNFKRFLEIWTDVRLNYAGSLINLFNSYNNNGRWKCCNSVYNPPIRDWTFDQTFTDPDRLPPGSPYVYYLSFTGFQRLNQ